MYVVSISQKGFRNEFIEGEHCSSIGLTRISGQDILIVCKHCGKVNN
ncbi:MULTISPECIES: hypothetical protein [Clostridium]|nr:MULTISPECIES: hypothetical protein [Clostridium]MBY7009581.1 hypothetical protein [Clostridium botulinum]